MSVRALQLVALADQIIADAQAPEACWRGAARCSAGVVRIDADADRQAEERARRDMIAAARAGCFVLRLRQGDGWRSTDALRDIRMLRSAGVDLEIVAGVSADAADPNGWLESRPLAGLRIVVTRTREQAHDTAELLRERGADPWLFPLIEIADPPDPSKLSEAATRVSSYDVVAFTSTNGVERFFEALRSQRLDARAFGPSRVAAIGEATAAALRAKGIDADIIAKDYRGEALAEAIAEACRDRGGRRVLIPRALEAREVLPDMLREARFEVDVVAAYQTIAPNRERAAPMVAALQAREIDAVLLTSSSTVRNLCEMLGEHRIDLLSSVCLASIGPIATDTARRLGLAVAVTAAEYTVPGLVRALEDHWPRTSHR